MRCTLVQSTLEDLWEDMADHFLDTETRTHIPRTALRCIDAGLTEAQAEHIWTNEVTPAVEFNLYDIAGEWACWDREWLVCRIRRKRRRWSAPGLRPGVYHDQWIAIANFMRLLRRHGPRAKRCQLCGDLTRLSECYFDFSAEDLLELGPEALARMRALYPKPFLTAIEPVVHPSEPIDAHRRVIAALAEPS